MLDVGHFDLIPCEECAGVGYVRNPHIYGDVWNCLRCDKAINDHEFDMNNGTCDECPPFTAYHPKIAAILSKEIV